MPTLDEDLHRSIREINAGAQSAPRPNGPLVKNYDFEEMGEKIAEGMLQAAKEQLMEAENMLRQTEQFADDIRQRAANKAAELLDLNNRLRILGASIVTAHQVFVGDAPKDKPK